MQGLHDQISQGDIFDNLPYIRFDRGSGGSKVEWGVGMLITHDCEYDKPTQTTVAVARVRLIDVLNAQQQSYLRDGRIIAWLHLPANENTELPESFVDLRNITTIDKQVIADRVEENKRLLSLTEEARLALRARIFHFFSRQEPPAN